MFLILSPGWAVTNFDRTRTNQQPSQRHLSDADEPKAAAENCHSPAQNGRRTKTASSLPLRGNRKFASWLNVIPVVNLRRRTESLLTAEFRFIGIATQKTSFFARLLANFERF
jgi:hypothetical protein